jgi:hypothetical protein
MLHFAIILLAHSITCCLSPLVFIPNLPYPGSRLLAHALSVTIFDRHFTTSLVASKACFNPTDPKWWCNHFCSCAAIQPTRLSLKSPHVIHVVMYAPAHMGLDSSMATDTLTYWRHFHENHSYIHHVQTSNGTVERREHD